MRFPGSLRPAACLLVLLVGAGLAPQTRAADVVEAEMPGGSVATAWYRAGDVGPAVLVLHGFLQTREYLTVRSLVNNLGDQGYTVLAPTLSLGVDRRRASLECEAIHAHSMAQDLAEIDAWVRWLENRGHDRVVLLGHSFGSLQLLAYASGSPRGSVAKLIATSLVERENSNTQQAMAVDRARARDMLARGDAGLAEFHLSYCQRYVAPAGDFLSYAEWSTGRVLERLASVSVPVEVIVGGSDNRMGADWVARLRASGVAVSVIPGAGHFFDAQYEFDLLDKVEAAIGASPGSGA